METVRRFVFPIIWMVIVAALALALVKLAFFNSDASAKSDDAAPAAAVDQNATVAVGRGDIASKLELNATVTPDDGSALKATDAGEISTIWVRNGDHVSQGDKILQVRVPREGAAQPDAAAPAQPTAAAKAAPAAATPTASYKYLTLKASADGTVKDLSALKGQTLNIGDTVATINPGTYAIVANLTPEQQLRLIDQPINATAKLPDSADPVACQAPSIQEKDPSKQSSQGQSGAQSGADTSQGANGTSGDSSGSGDTSGSGGSGSAAASLRCPVPTGTKIVPGLAVKVTVDLGTAQGVLTLPTTAVEGTGTAGDVYIPDDKTGKPTKTPVTLGKRDDDTVEVTGGLQEGQKVLQYVPGVENKDADDASQQGDSF